MDVQSPAGLGWASHNFFSMCVDPKSFNEQLDQPLRIGMGCSCSGAPTHALDQIITRKNYIEAYGSEKHAFWISSILSNVNIFGLGIR